MYHPRSLVVQYVLTRLFLILTSCGAVHADELDCWIWRSPRPHGQEVFELFRGGGLWVSLGHNGTIASSISGLDWDVATIGTNAPVVAGAYGNGVYVASAPARALYTSTDAHNWSKSPTNPGLNSIVFANGRFVGANSSGAVWSSTNGTHWVGRQLSFTHILQRVSYANGQFFALGIFNTAQNAYFTSEDGENWSNNAFPLGGNGTDKIVYGNQTYLALKAVFDVSGFRSEFRTSADAVAWNPPTILVGYQIEDVVFANGRFFAVEGSGRVLNSSDGETWAEHAAPSLFAATELDWSDGTFVAAGVLGGVASSTDGTNWTNRSIGLLNSLVGVSRHNGLLVAVGGNLGDAGANLSKGTVATSSNGKDWKEHDPGATNSLTDVTFGNGRYIAVGAGGFITTSTNATNWTAMPAISSNTLNGVAYGNGRFVGVGGDVSRATIVDSFNGLNWTAQNNATVHPTLYAISFAQNLFVAVGRTNSSRRPIILTSPDGLTWTPRTSTTTNSLRAISYASGSFVACGDRGSLLQSADGITWNDLSRNTTRSLRSVANGGGRWLIITSPIGHYTSTDAINWTFRSTLATTTVSSLSAAVFTGNSFLVVGPFGQILESAPFTPSQEEVRLSLEYTSAPFLKLSGPECRLYEIISTDSLTSSHAVSWQTHNTVSNLLGTVFLPMGPVSPSNRFYRAVLRP